jgi:chromate transporter
MTGIPFDEAVRVWWQVGLQSFGGPAAQIATMHRILVDEKKWIGEERFLHALNYCMLLPGPEAQQLAVYVGWLLHGVRGGIVAGVLFVLPGFLAVLALSIAYATLHDVTIVMLLLGGLKAAVLAVVVEAVVRIGRRVLKNAVMVGIAAAAFVALFAFHVPFPLVVLGAGALGLVGARVAPASFVVVKGPEAKDHTKGVIDVILDAKPAERPGAAATIGTALAWTALWLVPVAVLRAVRGPDDVYTHVGAFFAQAAAVTFGGAYAVLAYIGQQAVERYHWLTAPEMLDGLGMAETTPGPLILVTEYVAFLAGYRDPGALPPVAAGSLTAALSAWVTFVPSFLWIFTGAPFVEWLRGQKELTGALSAITAAVVGVVLNLAVWFGLHVLVHDGRVDPVAWIVAIAAAVAVFRFHVGMVPVLAGGAVLGAVLHLVVG